VACAGAGAPAWGTSYWGTHSALSELDVDAKIMSVVAGPAGKELNADPLRAAGAFRVLGVLRGIASVLCLFDRVVDVEPVHMR
jgi:hypothetical protein